jgi:ParB/RepB/Spo0J family partition protein
MTTEFSNIELALIEPSLTNPRKTFNPAKLADLTASIKASGVHQPVLVRPLPGSRVADTPRGVQYELVCGERRYRASVDAGVATIPALVRALTDEQVLEIQIVENLQRDDLTELEEAEGYEALMAHTSINADAVAAKIGKSRSYVFGRLKLLDLSQDCKQAMRDGLIDASRALLIARIPDSTLQATALKQVMEPDYRGDVMSVRAFQSWLQANVMLRLDKARFKITDSRLIASAGSCKDCPKRTGANPDLFADVSSADICTDTTCFHAKEDAHRNALIAKAAKKGMRFIEGKEAQELIAHQYTTHIDGYSPLSQVRKDITRDGETGLTLRELLGADAPGAVLIENPYNQELVEAVPTDEAEAVLLAKGLLQDTDKTNPAMGSAKDLARDLERLQLQATNKIDRRTQSAVLGATIAAIRATDDTMAMAGLLGSSMLRAWLITQLDDWVSNDEMALALGYTFQEGEDKADGLAMHIRAIGTADLHRAMACTMAMADDRNIYADYEPLVLNTLTDILDVPVKALQKKAAAEVRAEYADQIKATQAKIDELKPTIPAALLTQQAPGAAKAKPAARKGKMSAAEAAASIAAAMQDQDDGDDEDADDGVPNIANDTPRMGVKVA